MKPEQIIAQKRKLKAAFESITGCQGCLLNVLFQKDVLQVLSHMEVVAFPFIKEKNYEGKVDLVFVEGTVTNQQEIQKVIELRDKAKILVAVGACASHGCIPQIRNFLDDEQVKSAVYKHVEHLKSVSPTPINAHVDVDYYIKGCPMDKQEFLQFIKQMIAGKSFRVYEKPVCFKCNLQETLCRLTQNKECLGPITLGNCSVMCPHHNYACTGCRGPTSDANIHRHKQLLREKGLPQEFIEGFIIKYAGLDVKKIEKEQQK